VATLQAHGGAIAQCFKVEPSTMAGREVRFTRALCADGTLLQKVDSRFLQKVNSWDSTSWRGQGWKIRGKLKPGVPVNLATLEGMYPAWDFSQGPAKPDSSARYVMAKAGFNADPMAGPDKPLGQVSAAYARHAWLGRGFKGEKAPPIPAAYRPVDDNTGDGPGRLQAIHGGNGTGAHLGDATYPRGLEPGPFYPAMTYLIGRQVDGKTPATHAQLEPVARAFFEDPEGMRAAWLYHAGPGRWEPAWTARCPEMDPGRQGEYSGLEGGVGRRLGVLLARATGGEYLEDGPGAPLYMATVDIPLKEA
jgi:hypothetical protein